MARLEGQLARFKAQAEMSENVEDDLKAEKRKLQREVIILFNCPKELSSI